MTRGKKAVAIPQTAEDNFKKLTQLHRSRLYRVCLSKGLFVGQPGILLTIRELGSCSQTELATALDVTTPSVAVSVKRLERNGLISKEINENDNRYNRITLTRKGMKAALKCEKIFGCINDKMFADFSDDEMEQLNNFLTRMNNNLSNFDPEKDPSVRCPNPEMVDEEIEKQIDKLFADQA